MCTWAWVLPTGALTSPFERVCTGEAMTLLQVPLPSVGKAPLGMFPELQQVLGKLKEERSSPSRPDHWRGGLPGGLPHCYRLSLGLLTFKSGMNRTHLTYLRRVRRIMGTT